MNIARREFSGLLITLGMMMALTAFSASAAQAPIVKIDLNTATETQLAGLPGMNATHAKKIVQNRQYATINDLSKAGMKKSAHVVEVGALRHSILRRARRLHSKCARKSGR